MISGVDDVEGLLAVGGLDDFVAEEFEHVDGDVAHWGFVVDNEDAAKVGGGSIAQADERGVGGGCWNFLGDACQTRNEDAELGAAADFAVELDPAAVILDDFLSGGEAEAGAFSGFFGGEESFEDTLAIFRGDAAAVVANGDDDEGGGEGFGTGSVGAAGVFDLELDDATFFRKSVAGIDAEIKEDLFDLGAVAEDGGGGFGRFGSDADARVDAVAEEALDVGNDLAHVRGFFLHRAAAGVAEELFDEFGGPGGGLAGTFQAGFDFGFVAVGGEFGEGDVAVDGGEEIVEVVGDAAGDQAQGAHFLGFPELAFEEGDLGVVTEDPDLADDGTGLRDHGEGLEFDLDGGIEGQFAGQLTALVWSGGEFFEPGFFVLFGDEALFEEGGEAFAVAADEAFEGFAEEGVEFFIGGDD